MEYCDQATITGASFSHLEGADKVVMSGCHLASIAAARAVGLHVVK
jgi:hypothetical protein